MRRQERRRLKKYIFMVVLAVLLLSVPVCSYATDFDPGETTLTGPSSSTTDTDDSDDPVDELTDEEKHQIIINSTTYYTDTTEESATGAWDWVMDIILAIVEFILDAITGVIETVILALFGGNLTSIVLQNPDNAALFCFTFDYANPYGIMAAIGYSLLRAYAFVFLPINFAIALVRAILAGGTARGFEEVKSSFYDMVLKILLLILAPYIFDILISIRQTFMQTLYDGIFKEAESNIIGGYNNFFSLTDEGSGYNSITAAIDTSGSLAGVLLGFLMRLSYLGLTVYFMVLYVIVSISTSLLFIALPMICIRGKNFKDKFASWCEFAISIYVTPLIDLIVISVPIFLHVVLNSSEFLGVFDIGTDDPTLGVLVVEVVAVWFVMQFRGTLRQYAGLQDSGADRLGASLMGGIASLALRGVKKAWAGRGNNTNAENEAQKYDNKAAEASALESEDQRYAGSKESSLTDAMNEKYGIGDDTADENSVTGGDDGTGMGSSGSISDWQTFNNGALSYDRKTGAYTPAGADTDDKDDKSKTAANSSSSAETGTVNDVSGKNMADIQGSRAGAESDTESVDINDIDTADTGERADNGGVSGDNNVNKSAHIGNNVNDSANGKDGNDKNLDSSRTVDRNDAVSATTDSDDANIPGSMAETPESGTETVDVNNTDSISTDNEADDNVTVGDNSTVKSSHIGTSVNENGNGKDGNSEGRDSARTIDRNDSSDTVVDKDSADISGNEAETVEGGTETVSVNDAGTSVEELDARDAELEQEISETKAGYDSQIAVEESAASNYRNAAAIAESKGNLKTAETLNSKADEHEQTAARLRQEEQEEVAPLEQEREDIANQKAAMEGTRVDGQDGSAVPDTSGAGGSGTGDSGTGTTGNGTGKAGTSSAGKRPRNLAETAEMLNQAEAENKQAVNALEELDGNLATREADVNQQIKNIEAAYAPEEAKEKNLVAAANVAAQEARVNGNEKGEKKCKLEAAQHSQNLAELQQQKAEALKPLKEEAASLSAQRSAVRSATAAAKSEQSDIKDAQREVAAAQKSLASSANRPYSDDPEEAEHLQNMSDIKQQYATLGDFENSKDFANMSYGKQAEYYAQKAAEIRRGAAAEKKAGRVSSVVGGVALGALTAGFGATASVTAGVYGADAIKGRAEGKVQADNDYRMNVQTLGEREQKINEDLGGMQMGDQAYANTADNVINTMRSSMPRSPERDAAIKTVKRLQKNYGMGGRVIPLAEEGDIPVRNPANVVSFNRVPASKGADLSAPPVMATSFSSDAEDAYARAARIISEKRGGYATRSAVTGDIMGRLSSIRSHPSFRVEPVGGGAPVPEPTNPTPESINPEPVDPVPNPINPPGYSVPDATFIVSGVGGNYKSLVSAITAAGNQGRKNTLSRLGDLGFSMPSDSKNVIVDALRTSITKSLASHQAIENSDMDAGNRKQVLSFLLSGDGRGALDESYGLFEKLAARKGVATRDYMSEEDYAAFVASCIGKSRKK